MIRDVQRITSEGVAALQRGDAYGARIAFSQLEQAGHGSHQLRLLLAQACFLADDHEGAHAALDKVIGEEPTNLYALVMRGDLLQQAGDPRAAVSWYRAALLQAPRAGNLPPDLIEALRRAEQAVDDASREFHAQLNSELTRKGFAANEMGPRFVEALDILSGRAQVQLQRPTSFYYPGLSQRAFFDTKMFEWGAEFEAAAPMIRGELEALLRDGPTPSPYVEAEENRPFKRHPLLHDPRWSATYLLRRGEVVADVANQCPVTMAALARAPLPHIAGRAPMALFSTLRPGTHIPPHHGLLNTRLICHLPLIVPSGCRLRVGNVTRVVERDRLMIFDDSIEHEAWNDGSATRTVLLFEIWRPELDGVERAALTALYEAIELSSPSFGDQAGA